MTELTMEPVQPFPTVAILFGGRSNEHELSLQTAEFFLCHCPAAFPLILVGIGCDGVMFRLRGQYTAKDFARDLTVRDLETLCGGQVCEAFPAGTTVVPTTIVPLRRESLPPAEACGGFDLLNRDADVVFHLVHGESGEDGRFQGLFELAELAYVGCDMRASVVGIDKSVTKRLVQQRGVEVVPVVPVDREDWQERQKEYLQEIELTCGYPCFVKPNSGGSSVGVGRAEDQADLCKKIANAFCFDFLALVEPEIRGREVAMGFFGTPAHHRISSPLMMQASDWLSYDEKFGEDSTIAFSTDIPDEEAEKLRAMASEVARCLRVRGICRIDFFKCGKTGRYMFNEVNTLPGFSDKSLFPMILQMSGVSASEWIAQLAAEAQRHNRELKRLRTDFRGARSAAVICCTNGNGTSNGGKFEGKLG